MLPLSKSFKVGEVLFTEGESAHSLFIIQQGVVSIRKASGNKLIEVGLAQVNEILGEMSFFDHKPRSATAVALMSVEALEIPFEDLERIYSSNPNYMRTIVAAMAERLRKANEQISILKKRP